MKERPILFSGSMVQALLAGRKTQTRRVLKPQPIAERDTAGRPVWVWKHNGAGCPRWSDAEGVRWERFGCPYGQPGDRLWVRETWASEGRRLDHRRLWYRADMVMGDPPTIKWKPSIFMPRWACRLVLEVTDVRVERLQDISQEDAIAEGVERAGGFMSTSGSWQRYTADGPSCEGPRESFHSLWESIDGPESWAANPWVWCLSFKRVQP